MAQTAKRKVRSARKPLPSIHARAAGIDVGSTFHVVAVPPERADQPVRTFRSFTGELHQLADWLKEVGVTTVAMESTGVLCKPVFNVLEGHFDLLLCNAGHIKNVPGRKTDVSDSQWIQQLHNYGLLRGAFRPQRALQVLRT